VVGVTEEAHRITLAKWVEGWNARFTVDEGAVELQYTCKGVHTAGTPDRRVLLCVYPYLSIRDIANTAAAVCKAWYHISKDSEHWKARFLADFQPAQTHSQDDYLRKYIAHVRSACWHCQRLTALTDIRRKCRLQGQPLCVPCSRLKECRVVTLHSFCKDNWVARGTLLRLQVPCFECYSGKASYLLVIVSKLMPHAESRRKLLLSALRTPPFQLLTDTELELISQLDLESFYKHDQKSLFCPLVKSLACFCGKNGVREHLPSSILAFTTSVLSTRCVPNTL